MREKIYIVNVFSRGQLNFLAEFWSDLNAILIRCAEEFFKAI